MEHRRYARAYALALLAREETMSITVGFLGHFVAKIGVGEDGISRAVS